MSAHKERKGERTGGNEVTTPPSKAPGERGAPEARREAEESLAPVTVVVRPGTHCRRTLRPRGVWPSRSRPRTTGIRP